MDKIIVIAFILLFEYLFVLLMVMADLFSGVQKAKKNGVVRSSFGFRRTVEKLSRYLNLLIGLTIVDAIHISAIWYLETYYDYTIPLFPLFTLIGSLFMAFIELKSIYEKAEDKQRFEEVGKLAGKIIVNKNDLEEIAKSVAEYMHSEPKENGSIIVVEKQTKNGQKLEI